MSSWCILCDVCCGRFSGVERPVGGFCRLGFGSAGEGLLGCGFVFNVCE